MTGRLRGRIGSALASLATGDAGPTQGSDNRIAVEAQRFSEHDNLHARDHGWGAIPLFRRRLRAEFNLSDAIRRHLAGRDHPVAMTLACGDMKGEYTRMKQLGVAQIDAFDISEGQRDKFYRDVYDDKVAVNYTIADANLIELEPNRYDFVWLQHAYHHIERLEHVADEIRKSLKPGGFLTIVDYVGANFLQRTPRQRQLCDAIWKTMPARYRIGSHGKLRNELRIPRKEKLPPYEAIRAEEIVGVLEARFEPAEKFLYAGILFPLFNGFAQNYTESAEDTKFLRVMWDLDRWLIDTGAIEPNFIQAIYVPRP